MDIYFLSSLFHDEREQGESDTTMYKKKLIGFSNSKEI